MPLRRRLRTADAEQFLVDALTCIALYLGEAQSTLAMRDVVVSDSSIGFVLLYDAPATLPSAEQALLVARMRQLETGTALVDEEVRPCLCTNHPAACTSSSLGPKLTAMAIAQSKAGSSTSNVTSPTTNRPQLFLQARSSEVVSTDLSWVPVLAIFLSGAGSVMGIYSCKRHVCHKFRVMPGKNMESSFEVTYSDEWQLRVQAQLQDLQLEAFHDIRVSSSHGDVLDIEWNGRELTLRQVPEPAAFPLFFKFVGTGCDKKPSNPPDTLRSRDEQLALWRFELCERKNEEKSSDFLNVMPNAPVMQRSSSSLVDIGSFVRCELPFPCDLDGALANEGDIHIEDILEKPRVSFYSVVLAIMALRPTKSKRRAKAQLSQFNSLMHTPQSDGFSAQCTSQRLAHCPGRNPRYMGSGATRPPAQLPPLVPIIGSCGTRPPAQLPPLVSIRKEQQAAPIDPAPCMLE